MVAIADRVSILDEQLTALDNKMQGILDDADGSLSAEQRVEYDKLDADYEEKLAAKQTILDDLAREDRLAARRKTANDLTESLAGSGRATDPGGLEIDAKARIVEKPKKWLSLGDQLQAIAQADITGREHELLRGSWENLAVATGGAAAGVPSDGGYLIQKDFVTEMMGRMAADATLPPVRTIPIGPNSDGLKINVVDQTSRATGSRWGGVQVYWGAEGDAATATKPKFRQMELELKELIGLAYMTNRLMADASALEAVFMTAFSEEMNFMIENSRINGSGAGQPKGILSTTGATGTVSVAKETGQAAATVTYNNVLDMYSRLWGRSRPNAVWLINQDVEPSLNKMTQAVGTGGVPVYLPPGGAQNAPNATLLGRPVLPVEYCATLGTVGDIILWDPTQYIAIEKGGMQADQSIHVRFTTNENTFRFIFRTDGQPLWNSPLTPFKGSNTQSPQVTLATRA